MKIASFFPSKKFTTEHLASIPEWSENVSDTPRGDVDLWGKCLQKAQSSLLNFILLIHSHKKSAKQFLVAISGRCI